MISVEEPNAIKKSGHITVVGDKVYFQCERSESIVEYNIGEQELSVIHLPIEDEDLPDVELMGVHDGMLLFGTIVWPRLYLRSMEAGPNGAKGWARHRVIELRPLLPPRALFLMSVVGFAEGVGAIFLSTQDGVYTIELSSGQSKSVHSKPIFGKVMPYMSFYTRAWGRLSTSE
nr:uncharacterized protein LOC127349197 [Lolium perenne]